MSKQYYSLRNKIITPLKLSLDDLIRGFLTQYEIWVDKGYFQEFFGKDCPDGDISGDLGKDIEAVILLKLRRKISWPLTSQCIDSEACLFDLIEFLYEHCSKPIEGNWHAYNGCGNHFYKFDRITGRAEFKNSMNQIIQQYNDGYELTNEGIVICSVNPDFKNLFLKDLPL